MLEYVPLIMFAVVMLATLLRLIVLRRGAGIQAWAFGPDPADKIAGTLFVISLTMLGFAAVEGAEGDGIGVGVIAGSVVAIIGAIVTVVAQIQMGAAWRIGVRQGDASHLIEHGLYRHSRNPIFVGLILVGLGIAVVSGLWWAWAALAALVLSCHLQVRIEEAHMARMFGPDYAAFCRRVPRWVGV
jgi:protein-S-isoprenylcysteine O-methyltransferase Ste14